MKKIFITLGVIIGFLLLAAVLVPILFKDKIIAKVKTEINNNLNAKVDFGDFNISILRSFPNLSFSMEKLSVIGVDEFKGDTLTYVKSLDFTVDIMSVIKGKKIDIRKINIDQPLIYALVLKNGKSNWQITKPSPAEDTKKGEGSEFKMALKKLSITNAKIIYKDNKGNMEAQLINLNHTLSGDFTQDNFDLSTKTTIEALTVVSGGIKYLKEVKTDIKVDLSADMKAFKFTFKDNEFKLNDLALGLDGFVAMPDSNIAMDIKFALKKADFKSLLSLVPAIYAKDFKDLESSGKLSFQGDAKGKYNSKQLPAFNFKLAIENGKFKYAKLPAAVENVMVDLAINNADGTKDHTVINLSKFHMDLNKQSFDAKMIIKTPISDPDIDAMLKGAINLGSLQQIVPMEAGTTIAGNIRTDITANGKYSAIQNKKYENFKATGTLDIQGFHYLAKTMPTGFDISNAALVFSPQKVSLTAFDGKMGKSDMHIKGELEDFIGYSMNKGTVKGTLTFISTNMDLNEMMGKGNGEATKPTEKKDSSTMKVVEVPTNIDFTLNTTVGTLLYDNYSIKNVKGAVIVRDGKIEMKGLSMDMLDGNVVMNGSYDSKDIKSPGISFDLVINNFDITQTTKTFASVKKMAPIAEKCTGKYSTKIKFDGKLDGHMQPLLNTLNGGGSLATKQVVLSNFEPVNKVADALKIEKYKKLDLSNINLSFKFKEGRVFVDPFDMKFGSTTAKVFGSNGFDQTIDYTMDFSIPRSEFGGAANSAVNSLLGAANKAIGTNITIGDKVNVGAKIDGTVNKPSVKLAFKGTSGGTSNPAEDLKAKAKQEFDKKKAELEAQAKAQADKLKQEAENKTRAEADRLRAESEQKAKAAADKAKNDAAQKAKDKVKSFLPH